MVDLRDRPPEAQRVTLARRAAGLSQTEVATRLGVAQGTVARWESGRAVPSLKARTAYYAALRQDPRD